MRIQYGESSSVPGTSRYFTTTFLVNDHLAIDAGCLGFMPPETQSRVRNVFLSHSHIDHIGSLPLFLETVWDSERDCPTVHANEPTLDCLQTDLFNGRVWPDILRPDGSGAAMARLRPIADGESVVVDELKVTAIAVDHTVPTLAYLVEDATAAVIFAGDSGPTERLWQVANGTPNLRAVFLEAAFPNSMQWLADVSRHLTPATFRDEILKLENSVAILAVHVKARFHQQTVGELLSLGLPVEIASPNAIYAFE